MRRGLLLVLCIGFEQVPSITSFKLPTRGTLNLLEKRPEFFQRAQVGGENSTPVTFRWAWNLQSKSHSGARRWVSSAHMVMSDNSNVSGHAVATSNAVPGANQGGDPVEQGKFNWHQQWYPVAVMRDLEARDPRQPYRIELLGEAYAVWKDKSGEWRVFADRCPHRWAPLSEGRVDQKTGRLQCIYHGWEFNEDGSCGKIPQARAGTEENATGSKRACVRSVPTKVVQEKLWVWPDSSPEGVEASKLKHPAIVAEMDDPEYDGNWYMRDLPYGWDTLMENLGDPAHLPFAHHGVLGRRTSGANIGMVIEEGAEGEKDSYLTGNFNLSQFVRQTQLGFQAPCLVYYKSDCTEIIGPLVDGLPQPFKLIGKILLKTDKRMKKKAEDRGPSDQLLIFFVGYSVPTSPGKSRIFTRTARNFFFNQPILPSFGRNLVAKAHLRQHLVLDGDTPVLHYQERDLYAREKATTQGGDLDRTFYMPTDADTSVREFRKWLKARAGGGPDWVKGTDPSLGPVLERDVMLDRLHAHTLQCSECSRAYHGAIKAKQTLGAGAFLSVAVASVVPRGALAVGFLMGGITSAGLALFMAKREQEYVFVDYVHGTRDG